MLLAGLVATVVTTMVDAVEICCRPKSTLTEEVRKTGLNMERISIENGFNLSTRRGFDAAVARMKEMRPRRAWISLPCTLWSSLTNSNYTTEDAKKRLERDRQRDRRRVTYGLRLLLLVVDDGGEVYFEWPHRCQGWHIPEMEWFRKELVRRGRKYYEDRLDGCMYGLRDPYSNKLLQKG